MSYKSEFFLEEFENAKVKNLTIILNKIEIHSKQKYLLIVAQDLDTNKIVKLIDTHGAKYDLCKYSDNWAKLNKGDVISVKCEFYNSKYCVNVLRIKSNYTLVESINLYEELKKLEDELFEKEKTTLDSAKKHYLNAEDFYQDIATKQQSTKNNTRFTMKHRPDLYFLSKKMLGKYGFVVYYLIGGKLIKFKRNNTDKIKYQFASVFCNLPCYADIEVFIPNIDEQIGKYYTGFVLLQFSYKNNRPRAKVYDLLGDSNCFDELNYKTDKAICSLGENDILLNKVLTCADEV